MTTILYKGNEFVVGELTFFEISRLKGAIGVIGQEHLEKSGRYVLDGAQVFGAKGLWERVVVIQNLDLGALGNRVERLIEIRLE